MMKLLPVSSLALLSLLALPISADSDPNSDQYCFVGCQQAISTLNLNFSGSPGLLDPYPLQQCLNELFVQSVYACALLYCDESNISYGAQYADSECEGASIYNETTQATVDSLSEREMEAISRFDYGFLSEDTVNYTVAPSQDLFELGDRTIRAWYKSRHYDVWYSRAMWLFWTGIILIGVLSNFLSAASYALQSQSQLSNHGTAGVMTKLWRSVRAHVLLPATFKQRCSVPVGQCTIPPRIESLVIFSFVVVNVVLCAVSYEAFPRNLYWDQTSLQLWRYIADRTGYLAYANLAICWLFAIRNNVLLWMTGWSFATFNRFHRWVARLATLEAVLHSVAYTAYSFVSGGFEEYAEDFLEQYWYTGVIATVSMSFIMGFSVMFLRVRFYDFFLLTHIGLSLMALVNLFYHTKIFDGKFDGWLWSCVAFWVFDRVCRVVRVLYMVWLRHGVGATAELDDDADLIRIDLNGTNSSRPITNGYYFMYSPVALFAWENHPFTLVHWKQAVETSTSPVSPIHEVDGKATLVASSSTSSIQEDMVDRYTFLVRPYNGYTAYLRGLLAKACGPKRMSYLLEGPYGHTPNLRNAKEAWFFIGGSGISVAVTSIYELLEHNPNASIRLVWSSRSPSLIDAILERELSAALKHANFAIDAYVTGSKQSLRAAHLCRSVSYHRPNISMLLQSAASSSSTTRASGTKEPGSLAVVVCGPGSLTDDVRKAFCEELKATATMGRSESIQGQMDLFIESFNW